MKIIETMKKGKLVPAKNKWAGPNRPMMMGAGFPDFIAFKKVQNYVVIESENIDLYPSKPTRLFNDYSKIAYEIIGVESKMTGVLDKEEIEKCKWLLENQIFSKILIASKHKIKNKIVVEYTDFKEEYG